jgi:pimeloyl-ACP methyl ester carboxylesterase
VFRLLAEGEDMQSRPGSSTTHCRTIAALLCLGLVGAAAKPVLIRSDDVMDSPRPREAVRDWTAGAGRSTISLYGSGAVLRGYRYAGRAPDAPILIVFGGSGNLIARHDSAMRGFARFASSVIFYDYRGYGFSRGGPVHFDTLRNDALRIVDSAVARNRRRGVALLGYSMGTDIAAYAATKRRVSGLILAAPWDDYMGVLRYSDPAHTYRLTAYAAHDFDEAALVRRIACPLLIVQGTNDDAIPPSQGRRLESVAASPEKRFVPIVGAKHNGLLENPQTQVAVGRFLNVLRRQLQRGRSGE